MDRTLVGRKMERVLRQNILKIYAMGFFQSFQVVIPVLVPLMLGQGLSMAEILQTQAIYALTIALFEVPSGYMADIYGRKRTLVISALLALLAYSCLAAANSFADFVLFELVMGVAMSLSSGTDTAIMFDSQLALQKLNSRFRLPPSVGKLMALSGVAEGTAAVLATIIFLIADRSDALEWVLIAQMLGGVPCFLLAMSLVEPPRQLSSSDREVAHGDNAKRILAALLFDKGIVLWTAVAMIIFGLLALFSFWTYQSFWRFEEVPIEYFGLLWAAHCVVRSAGARFASKLESMFGAKRLLLFISALPIVGLLLMVAFSGWAAVFFALLLPLSRGLNAVIFFDSLNARVDGEFRATINSLLSLVARTVFIFTGPLLGMAMDKYGVENSLLLLTAVFLPLVAFVTVMLCKQLSKLEVAAGNVETIDISHKLKKQR